MTKTVVCLLAVSLFCTVLAKKNLYMVKGSDEYKKLTQNIIGNWQVTSYTKGEDGEQLGSVYKDISFVFSEPEKDGKSGIATYTFMLKDSVAQERFSSWKKSKDYEGHSIQSYSIVGEMEWEIEDDGKILYFEDESFSVNIKGDGKKFKNFVGYEQSIIESASSSNSSGDLNSMIMGGIMKSATGVSDFYPSLPSQSNPEFSGEELKLKTTSDNKLALKKM